MLLSYLQTTFFLASVEANRELLEALEGLGLAEGGYGVLDIPIQVEVELVAVRRVVPAKVLLFRFEFCGVFCDGTGLLKSTYFSICRSCKVGIPIDAGEGSLERLP